RRGGLEGEVDGADAVRIANGEVMRSGAVARAAFAFQEARRNERRAAAAAARKGAQSKAGNAPAPPEGAARNPASPPAANTTARAGVAPQQIYLDEAKARFAAALAVEIGFAERLAGFWSNHFCVSAHKAGGRPMAGALA